MDWLSLLTQLGGSSVGEAASSMDKDAAMKLIQSAVDDYGKINVPKLQQLFLQKRPGTQLANIKDDAVYRSQQNAADAQLNDVINSGGLTLADRASLNAIRNKTARTEAAGRNATLGSMAARGTLDSGTQLAADLQGNQQSAEGLAAADEATAGQAQKRAFEAIRERASLAGAGLDRDYRRQADAARAQDAINAGNAEIANMASKYNSTLPGQDFENQLKLAGAKLGPGYALSGAKAASAKDTQQKWNQYGNMAGAALRSTGDSRSAGGGSADFSGSDRNTPGFDESTNNGVASQPGEWNQYPGSSSDAVTGASTKDPDIIGYTADGKPIRRSAQGSNY